MVLFGGWTSAGRLDQTWTWDGSTWTRIYTSPSETPPSRSGGAMVYDAANHQILMFGGAGITQAAMNDTWKWNGAGWTKLTPATSPSGRAEPQMAYDAKNQQVLLFGGNNNGPLNDTWVWNNSLQTWQQKTPQVSPQARSFGQMAYDANSQKIVLFGGMNGSYLNDTWTWDGSNWSPVVMTSPPAARLGADMDFDGRHLILAGGEIAGTMASDVWFWDGTTWVQQTTLNMPSPLGHIALAYDSDRQQMILFGGGSALGVSNRTMILQEVPVVPTESVTNVTETSADLQGNVTYEGRTPVTERGIVLSTSENPAVSDSSDIRVPDTGSGLGSFTVTAKGLAAGTTYHYRAYATNGQTTGYGVDRVFKTISLSRLELDSSSYRLNIHDTHQTAVTAVYSDQSTLTLNSGVLFTSSDPAVASVDSTTGLVTAVSEGTAVITAEYRGLQAPVTVTVNPPTLSYITLDSASYTLRVQDTHQTVVTAVYSDNSNRIPNGVVFTSSNPAVASIDPLTGVVTALAEGTTNIIVVYENQQKQATVTVVGGQQPAQPTLSSLTLNPSSITLSEGSVANVTATAAYSNKGIVSVTNDVQWTFSASGIASVNSGIVSGLSVGTTVATATYGGISAELSITITAVSSGNSNNSNNSTTVVATPTPQPAPAPTPTPVSKPDIFASGVVKSADTLLQSLQSKVQEAQNKTAQVQFIDVNGHWAQQDINTFVKLQMVQGYKDGSFRPNDSITRAEFAVMVSRVFPLQTTDQARVSFADITAHWAKNEISPLVQLGVLKGYGDGTFKPNQTISREEMVVIMSRIVILSSINKDSVAPKFLDLTRSYAAQEITDAAGAGIVKGKSEAVFDPKGKATRAEALTILINTLDLNDQIKALLTELN